MIKKLFNKKSLVLSLLSLFLSACVTQPSYSQDLTQSQLYYHEGRVRVELKIQDGILAEFGVHPDSVSKPDKSVVRNADKTAQLLKNKGSINIWRTNTTGGSIGVSKTLNQNSEGKFSPVFQSINSSTNLALPGNIIVELEPTVSEKQAEVFFGSKGLRIFKKLELIGRNFYEIETPAGAASLNIANSIYGQPGVISSTPNWWREVVAK